jgi:hypothetical protein
MPLEFFIDIILPAALWPARGAGVAVAGVAVWWWWLIVEKGYKCNIDWRKK